MIIWVGYVFCYWLISMDKKWRPPVSLALWIPGIWLALLGSRPPSFWLSPTPSPGSGPTFNNLDGSPINFVVNTSLIIGAFIILSRRRFDWGEFIRKNPWLVVMYLYFAVSGLWSDFPLASFKRWFNNFGQVVVGLVILTETVPAEAMRATYVRVAAILLPLSVLLVRFTTIGRGFSRHGGEVMVIGVAEHKNALGEIVWILGLITLWDFLESRKSSSRPKTLLQKCCRIGILVTGLYILVIAKSATAQVCFLAGSLILLSHKYLASFKDAKRFLTIGGISAACFMLFDSVFSLKDGLFAIFGRDPTMTGRTDIWKAISAIGVNSLVGAGYRTFWDKAGISDIWIKYLPGMNQLMSAHNGYLETYLNGGIIGVILLVIWLMDACSSAMAKLSTGNPIGKVALAYWLISLIANNSESSFLLNGPLWFTLVLVAMRCPEPRLEPALTHARFGSNRISGRIRSATT